EAVEEVAIVRPAAEPDVPAGGEKFSTVVVGGLLGLMLGLVFAFVQETLDTSIGTIEDVEGYLEVPVLGVVPHIDARETTQRLVERRPELRQMDPEALRNHALLITHFDPKSPVAEAYRTLRTNLQFARLERQGKLLVVTSPTLQEGKTTTIVNLALTMAQNGQRTLLVGANLRRPSIYRFFGIEREPGLSDILVGNAQWRDCVRGVADILMGRFEMEDIMASPGLDNLHIIEAGPIPANPSELLSTPAMAAFLKAVSAEYDIVLIDTPPVLPVTDSAIVAGQVDGVLLVYQAGKVGRLVLKRAKAHLESARAKVWGVVLNDLQTEVSGYTYTHYYTHYYGEETTPGAPTSSGGRVQRAFDFVRGRFGTREAVAETADVQATASARISPSPSVAMMGTGAGKSGGRRSLVSVLILAGLLAILAGVAAWQSGWLKGDLSPRALLRQRLGDSPPPTVPRPEPRPPAAPKTLVPPAAPVTVAPSPIPAVASAPPVAPSPASAPPITASAPTAVTPAPVPPKATPSATASTPPTTAPAVAAKATPPLTASTPPATAPAAPKATPPVVTPAPAAVAAPVAPKAAAAAPKPASVASAPSSTAAVVPKSSMTAAPSAPAATPSPAAPRQAVASITTPAPSKSTSAAVATPKAADTAPRFALEFGPFVTAADAERVERQLTQAGYPTVRFRQQTGGVVYAVLVERIPTTRDAQALIATFREQKLGEGVMLGTEPISVRVGEPLPLRGAIELAERLRAAGHQVRVAAQPGDAVAFIIRHGSFTSRDDAEARGRELAQQRLPNQVVQVR
ncbi:MAG TPA: polysaccharide biosynthesis tyrosine autokinase, partial [Methylomirabilota bacterium]|nr:polysaccharide biosynthesis tyrosine autokinase [Methylomirabilota bacterium]